MQVLPIYGTNQRCHGNHFLAFCVYIGATWRIQLNRSSSVCVGDAALCQIILSTCLIFGAHHNFVTGEALVCSLL